MNLVPWQAVDEMLSAAFKRATPVLAKLPPGVVPVEAPEKSPLPPGPQCGALQKGYKDSTLSFPHVSPDYRRFVELDRGLLQQLEEADRVVQAAAGPPALMESKRNNR